MSEEYVYYKLSSLHGSITHYFHFFYGVLIPLIIVHIDNVFKKKKIVYIIGDDLGNMLRILLEIPIDIKLKMFVDENVKFETKYLKPMDIHPTLNKHDIKKVKKGWASNLTYEIYKKVNIFMKYCIEKYNLNLCDFTNKEKEKSKKNILIIERKKQHGFNTIKYEKNSYTDIMKTSGSERRSIINHEEIVKLIKKHFGKKYNIINISTEYMSIYQQYILFNNADIVFAQHGAALANILFMKEKKDVIEIISKVKLNGGDDWFKPISKICKINHHQYITNEEHTKINLKDFKEFLEKEKLI